MQWQIFSSTFVAVFLAELGDKTQLATLLLATESASRWSVFLGAALALVATSAIAVVAGDAVGRWISPVWLRRIAGACLVLMGLVFLVRPQG